MSPAIRALVEDALRVERRCLSAGEDWRERLIDRERIAELEEALRS